MSMSVLSIYFIVFSYGPWADRQRELLYKFFLPPDYQTMKATPEPKAGEKRVASMFQVRLRYSSA